MANEKQIQTLDTISQLLSDNLNVGTIDLRELIDGEMKIMKSGKLKIELALPADVVLPSQDVRHVINGNWRSIPVLLFVHPEDVRDEDGNLIEPSDDPTEDSAEG